MKLFFFFLVLRMIDGTCRALLVFVFFFFRPYFLTRPSKFKKATGRSKSVNMGIKMGNVINNEIDREEKSR